jgi:hypothetical protein
LRATASSTCSFLLEPAHAIPAAAVVLLLRETYHQVALATAVTRAARESMLSGDGGAASCAARASSGRDAPSARAEGEGGARAAPRRERAGTRDGPPQSALRQFDGSPRSSPLPPLRQASQRDLRGATRDLERALHDEAANADAQLVGATKVDAGAALERLLADAVARASARRSTIVRVAQRCAFGLVMGGALFLAAAAAAPPERPSDVSQFDYLDTVAAAATLGVALLALSLSESARAVARSEAAFAAVVATLGLVVCVRRRWLDELSRRTRAYAARAPPRAGGGAALVDVLLLAYGTLVVGVHCCLLLARALGALGWHARELKRRRSGGAGPAARAPPAPAWLTPAAFRRALRLLVACMCSWLALSAIAKVVYLPSRAARAAPAATLALASLALAICASRRVAHCVVAALDRLTRPQGQRGALLSLAPLIGLDADGATPDTLALAREAARVFCVVELGAAARARLGCAEGVVDGGDAAAAAAVAASAPARGRSAPLPEQFGRARSRKIAPKPGSTAAALVAVAAPQTPPPPSLAAAAVPHPLVAAHAERADAIVVRAARDQPMMAELCAWAQRFETRAGRPPTVWLSDL